MQGWGRTRSFTPIHGLTALDLAQPGGCDGQSVCVLGREWLKVIFKKS